MIAHTRILIGIVAFGAITGAALAQPAPGTVTNIDGAVHGDWYLYQPTTYIPASQGHFGLDTLSVQEIVPEYTQIPTRGLRPAAHWADLWITVYRTTGSDGSTMIAVDKDVFNETFTHWTDFHMELGVGLGSAFQPYDGLEFKTDPAPIEQAGAFPNPPMSMSPHDLWWLADGQYPGVPGIPGGPDASLGSSARFWLGINIPNALFDSGSVGDGFDGEWAMITLRQHWTPTPGAAGVLALAGITTLRRRRDHA